MINPESVYVRIKNGSQELELNLPNASDPEKLVVLQAMMNTLGIRHDFVEMVNVFYDTFHLYQEFFERESGATDPDMRIEPIPRPSIPVVPSKRPIFLSQITNEDKAWSGIEFSSDHRPRYKIHYQCHCGNQQNRYVFERTKSIPCSACKQKVFLVPATENGHPQNKENLQNYRDEFGNYYVSENRLNSRNNE